MSRDPYRKIAKWYDLLAEAGVRGLRGIGMKIYPPKEGMIVLDVGCGTGSQLALYEQAGCKVFGIDSSPAMLKVAQEKLGESAELRLADASQIPYSDETFDLITAVLTLHEMPAPVREAVMKESKRVMKKDGRILIIDYHTGPLSFPKGWIENLIVTIYEMGAGREHYKNYRDFLARHGLPPLITQHKLTIAARKVVGGGNFVLYFLASE
jgi:demethylmenaquinone methyltransferase/2-methoxy-6-polyprenyl-1,4-benzoquinol methylase